jgi:hypothetical protein
MVRYRTRVAFIALRTWRTFGTYFALATLFALKPSLTSPTLRSFRAYSAVDTVHTWTTWRTFGTYFAAFPWDALRAAPTPTTAIVFAVQ